MVKCGLCGTENRDPQAKYCEGCGMELHDNGDGTGDGGTGGGGTGGGDTGGGGTGGTGGGSVPTPGARLLVKRFGAVTNDALPLNGTRMIVGRFDPSSGPLDIDLSQLPGAEHVSRRHAEIYAEAGVWKVRDLGSTNGIFIRRASEGAFSPRLQQPAELHDGDEVSFGNMTFVFRVA